MKQAVAVKNKAKLLLTTDIYGALNGFIEALEHAERDNDLALQLEINIELCYIHRSLSNMKDGFSASVNAARLSKHLMDKEQHLRAYNFMGIFCFYTGLYKRAIHYFFYALDQFGDMVCNELYASIHSNLGETYQAIGSLNSAVEYMEKARDFIYQNDIKAYYTPILCNLGNVYLKKNDLKAAEELFKEAYDHQELSKDMLYLAELDLKFGDLYLHKNENEKALAHLIKSEQVYRKLNNKFYLIDVLLKMSELVSQLDEDTRTACLYEARSLAEITMAQDKIAVIEHKLYEIALHQENHKKALEHFRAFHEHSARSDVNNLLSKLEIMSIEHDFRTGSSNTLDLQDFASMDIFGAYDVEDIVDSLRKDLQYKAHTDELTDLPNRRKINDHLKNMLQPRDGKINGLLIIDIDHFKRINDNEGHLYGDRCLIRVSQLFKEWSLSTGHFVGRYGGEEFLCILLDCDEEELMLQGEVLRQTIEKDLLPYNVNNETFHLTISIGGVSIRRHSETDIFESLEKADQALYKAKSDGRNCVRIDRA